MINKIFNYFKRKKLDDVSTSIQNSYELHEQSHSAFLNRKKNKERELKDYFYKHMKTFDYLIDEIKKLDDIRVYKKPHSFLNTKEKISDKYISFIFYDTYLEILAYQSSPYQRTGKISIHIDRIDFKWNVYNNLIGNEIIPQEKNKKYNKLENAIKDAGIILASQIGKSKAAKKINPL